MSFTRDRDPALTANNSADRFAPGPAGPHAGPLPRSPAEALEPMRAPELPPDWDEPAQTPEFDEVTLVLNGTIVVHHDGGELSVPTGQAVLTRRGERVRYASPDGAEYISICLPAFSPEAAHRES